VSSHQGDRRFKLPGARHGVTMHRDEHKPPALVESQGIEIVVSRDQPQPGAPDAPGDPRHGLHKDRAGSLVRRQRVQRHKFASGPIDPVRDQSGGHAGALSDQRGKMQRVVNSSTTDDRRRAPAVAENPLHPFPVAGGRRPNMNPGIRHSSRSAISRAFRADCPR